MTTPLVKELVPWAERRLVCALGHTYSGRVRTIATRRADMDGEPLWSEPHTEFEPDTCVVCGLKTWRTDGES